jgi:hypothetical protein
METGSFWLLIHSRSWNSGALQCFGKARPAPYSWRVVTGDKFFMLLAIGVRAAPKVPPHCTSKRASGATYSMQVPFKNTSPNWRSAVGAPCNASRVWALVAVRA